MGDVKNGCISVSKIPAEAEGTEEEVLPIYRRVRDEIKRDFTAFYNNKVKV
jgi:hypothetical protein